MYNVAVVDDNKDDAALIAGFIREYFRANNYELNLDIFSASADFIEKFTPKYDLIFLDVEMPMLSGMEVAREIRLKDESVCIVFVTCFASYAVKGYEVAAFDYFVKPITYGLFCAKMTRIMREVNAQKAGGGILLKEDSEFVRVLFRDIKYAEVLDHYVYYHAGDKIYKVRQSMKSAEQNLKDGRFLRCNSCYIVNMAYVTGMRDGCLILDDEKIQMSRPRRKECLEKLADYLGRGW